MTFNSWHLWAKTDKDHPERWHALPWHLVEVGAVAQELWRVSLSERRRARLSSRLGLTDEETARFIGFIAAVHDFGKASRRFQSMSPQQVLRLESLPGSTFTKDHNTNSLRHSLISYGLLVPLFEREFGWHSRIAVRYAQITAAHHGRFWSTSDFQLLDWPKSQERMGVPGWNHLHLQLFNDLRTAFDIDSTLTDKLNAEWTTDPNYPPYEDALWLAGLISIADWIGSDERYFRFNPVPAESFDQALGEAKKSAMHALIATGWASPPLTISAATFASAIRTLPAGAEPKPAQLRAIELTREMSSPGMTVIEIPMGWGKTEIALWLAAHYAETADITGTYFALPTMATSDQLYDRVYRHLIAHVQASDRKRIVPLHLLHGMADLSARDELPATSDDIDTMQRMSERLDKITDPDADNKDVADRNSVVRRARWFTRKKHGLLAHYGVGTVDQALMSVLLTPHLFVRLFGLSGKTVVFDEVHSYDVYMSSLFDRLLEFLGALGSPVIILSATLPQHRTREMLAAYARGAQWTSEVQELASYPRISAIDDTRTQSVSIETPETDTTTLHLEWYPSDDESMWIELASRLTEELRDGGTVAIICNTVRSAQECYLEMAKHFPAEDLTLFHARFRQMDRAAIQDDVLRRFGKDAGKDRPHRHIVIATQVIEQSLDLDFDLMVTMFCPTDLALQRAGRLQRHRQWDEQRPLPFRYRARLWIVGFNDDGDNAGPVLHQGSRHVYGEYVLLRSWLALAGRMQITIPADVEALIEATYGPDPVIPTVMQSRFETSYATLSEQSLRDEKIAASVCIPHLGKERNSKRTDVLLLLSGIKQDPDNEPEAHTSRLALTRLGSPSISLVIIAKEDLERIRRDDTAISLEMTRNFLGCSMSVSSYDLVKAAHVLPTPPGWEESAHLRHHKLIVLDDNGEAVLGDIQLRYDIRLGLIFKRPDTSNDGEANGQ